MINRVAFIYNNLFYFFGIKKRSIIFVFYFLTLFAVPATAADEIVFSAARKTLLVNIVINIVSEAYQQIGLDVKVLNLPGNRAISMSNKGETDGELMRVSGIEKKYKNLIMIPVPVYTMEGMAVTKNSKIKAWPPENISGLKAGRVRGIIWAKNFTRGMPEIVFNDYETLIKVMRFRDIDVAFIPKLALVEVRNKLKVVNLRVIEPPMVKIKLYHYLNKKNGDIVPLITEVLKRMEKENRFLNIKKEIISSLYSE